MKTTQAAGIGWTPDFIVIEGELPAAEALVRMKETTARWIIVWRHGGLYLYAFRVEEILDGPYLEEARAQGADFNAVTIGEMLQLHEHHASTKTQSRISPPPIDTSWRPALDRPSIFRYVECSPDGVPLAVGEPLLAAKPPRRSIPREIQIVSIKKSRHLPSASDKWFEKAEHLLFAKHPADGYPLSDDLDVEDEGTAPLRYPSIDVDKTPAPEACCTFSIDLLRHETEDTQGGPIEIGPLPADWKSLDLSVALSCPSIEFKKAGRGTVTIRRNADSIPAKIKGVIRADVVKGTVLAVVAHFFDGTRFCGLALRLFAIGEAAAPLAATAPPGSQTIGTVVAEPAALRPDVTVYISKADSGKLKWEVDSVKLTGEVDAGKLKWLVITDRFDGLPPKLSGETDLGQSPATEAAALFREFAVIERGQHKARIEGFGNRLWQRAPQMFREVYWALWDHYKRRLTIQFICEDPHLPWELMRPVRTDESEIHPPLALKHSVARWITRWDGYMRNRLPGGRIYTIAPKYLTASRQLPRAQSEAQALVDQFHAERVEGTRLAVTALLEAAQPQEPVAILHFAGHGKFSGDAPTESSIKLEDGALSASEIERPEVKLGRACRTLVFFNACEVGATGSVLGEIGGWADAFLGRQFGGFIAPLWSVDDEDAGIVATELLDGIVNRHEPVGEVLRAVREKHGDVSPTFYSYLYYGDVTARVDAQGDRVPEDLSADP